MSTFPSRMYILPISKHEYRYVARTQKQYLCMQAHNYATLACYGEFEET
jgi:hypothetical protein